MKADKRPIYEITINYKSGVQMVFDCYAFECDEQQWKWEIAESNRSGYAPVILSPREIESVWQRIL